MKDKRNGETSGTYDNASFDREGGQGGLLRYATTNNKSGFSRAGRVTTMTTTKAAEVELRTEAVCGTNNGCFTELRKLTFSEWFSEPQSGGDDSPSNSGIFMMQRMTKVDNDMDTVPMYTNGGLAAMCDGGEFTNGSTTAAASAMEAEISLAIGSTTTTGYHDITTTFF
jgi:hypothetical protein